jgi:hypothetical protein
MITALPCFVSNTLLEQAHLETPTVESRFTINSPTGNFFYDHWKIKPEFENTVWEKLLRSLPFDKGEARIIVLNQRECYSNHSDIDDRWHLNISSKCAYLISLDTETMYETKADGIWYEMDASHKHTAINFGNRRRIQLVVRKLLERSTRQDLVPVSIKTNLRDLEDARYEFDNSISSFLNRANKENAVNNFSHKQDSVSLDLAPEYIDTLKTIAGNDFGVITHD